MECPVCKNEMIEKKVKYYQEWKNKSIIFDNVPVTECTICKERLLDGKIVDRINKSLWDLPKSQKKEEVDIYEFASI
jgi:YgiT-type zinc finger domain-containing protein